MRLRHATLAAAMALAFGPMVSQQADAIGVAGAQAKSSLYEPLRLDVRLALGATDEFGANTARIATADQFAAAGLPYPSFAGDIHVSYERGSNPREPVLRLRSTRPIYEPVVRLLLEFRVGALGTSLVPLTVMLDTSFGSPLAATDFQPSLPGERAESSKERKIRLRAERASRLAAADLQPSLPGERAESSKERKIRLRAERASRLAGPEPTSATPAGTPARVKPEPAAKGAAQLSEPAPSTPAQPRASNLGDRVAALEQSQTALQQDMGEVKQKLQEVGDSLQALRDLAAKAAAPSMPASAPKPGTVPSTPAPVAPPPAPAAPPPAPVVEPVAPRKPLTTAVEPPFPTAPAAPPEAAPAAPAAPTAVEPPAKPAKPRPPIAASDSGSMGDNWFLIVLGLLGASGLAAIALAWINKSKSKRSGKLPAAYGSTDGGETTGFPSSGDPAEAAALEAAAARAEAEKTAKLDARPATGPLDSIDQLRNKILSDDPMSRLVNDIDSAAFADAVEVQSEARGDLNNRAEPLVDDAPMMFEMPLTLPSLDEAERPSNPSPSAKTELGPFADFALPSAKPPAPPMEPVPLDFHAPPAALADEQALDLGNLSFADDEPLNSAPWTPAQTPMAAPVPAPASPRAAIEEAPLALDFSALDSGSARNAQSDPFTLAMSMARSTQARASGATAAAAAAALKMEVNPALVDGPGRLQLELSCLYAESQEWAMARSTLKEIITDDEMAPAHPEARRLLSLLP